MEFGDDFHAAVVAGVVDVAGKAILVGVFVAIEEALIIISDGKYVSSCLDAFIIGAPDVACVCFLLITSCCLYFSFLMEQLLS